MNRIDRCAARLSSILLLACAGNALAGPLAFYAGGAMSRTDIRVDQIPGSPLTSWSPTTNGWKVFVGWRPISLLGFEASYRDLGNESAVTSANVIDYTITYTGHVHATATTLEGLLYAPIPLPYLDLYAKAGVSRLRHHTTLDTQCTPVSSLCSGVVSSSSAGGDQTVATLGAGVQVKINKVALRAELEQDIASGADPRQVSLGVAWEF
jgi:Outer membrane protein beta-barrel domain